MNKEVSIPIDRYEELITLETRVQMTKEHVIKTQYSLFKDDIAWLLGFELPKEKEEKI